MQSLQKHIILLVTILLWSCVSVFAGEVRVVHFLKDSYASGERTVKSSGENAAMFVNAEFAGGMTNTAKFSLYVSPYLVANQGGRYTKHIYIGSQRIVSKLGDLKSYGADPRRIEYAGSESDGPKVDYKTKYALQQQVIKDNFAHFDVPYNGADNNDYVDGKGFAELDGSLEGAMMKAAMAQGGNKSAGLKDNFQQGDSYEQYQYFYHPDHLGSSSFITNTEGEVVQHIEYVPYGEVFIEERNNVWNTPYLFNAKEFDEETGLYYYGARYYDSRLAMWYGVDALAEKYPNMSPYNYCMGNPVKFVDLDGNAPKSRIEYRGNGTFGINKNNMSIFTRFYLNLANNDPSCWRSGEIGLNTTILSFSYKPYQYDKKLPGIDPADRNRTFSNDATPLTQKGLPDRRYKPRMATYSYMGNVPTASGKAFAVGSLAIDVTIMGLQSAQSYMMLSDLDALNTQKNSLTDAFFSVKQYVSSGGILPPEYNNSDGYGKLIDYVFQGSSGLNLTQNLNGQYYIDNTIQQIGNQILKSNGRYDKKNDKYKFFIEE